MPSIDRPGYCDWETSWWWTSSVRYEIPKALQMTYCELCWKIHDDGGATKNDLPYLARFLMDTEDNIRRVLQLPHFYEDSDGAIRHRTVDTKLGEQQDRRLAGKRAAEARWEKAKDRAEKKGDAARNATRNAGGNAARNATPNTYEGLPAGKTPASEKRPGGTSASRTALAPGGRGAGAGTRPAESGPVHPDARFPTEYDPSDHESVRAKDGGWIHLPTGDRLPPPGTPTPPRPSILRGPGHGQ